MSGDLVTCEECGVQVPRSPSPDNRQRFCSQRCQIRAWQRAHRERAEPRPKKACLNCGGEFAPKNAPQAFCGAGCLKEHRRKTKQAAANVVPVLKCCETCGKQFVSRRVSGKRAHRYCSDNCGRKGWQKGRNEAGLCLACKNPASPGDKLCQSCRDVARTSGRKAASERAKERRASGLCVQCGAPSTNRKCPTCADAEGVSRLKKTFGLSIEEYARRLEEQGGGCAICGRHDSARRLAVDHDHAFAAKDPGGHRGLLCAACNTALGAFGDSPERLRKAAAYLERWSQRRLRMVTP